jgi:ubiquinone/menaquinone biosynthesis C-methylase UbiE
VRSPAELKRIFQEAWNIPLRVENYTRNVARAEFADAACVQAWCHCLQRALSAEHGLNILDVGSGPGIFAGLYTRLGHQCTGLDFSHRMLAAAHTLMASLQLDCTFVFGDAEDPPFAAETFDAVSSRHLLFNLPRPGVAVRQWVRLLKPGGKMILIGDDLRNDPRPSLRLRAKRLWRYCRRPFGKRHSPGWKPAPDYLQAVSECPLFRHTPGAVRAVMEAAGLVDICACPTDEIYRARQQNQIAARKVDFPLSRPFILTGSKVGGG